MKKMFLVCLMAFVGIGMAEAQQGAKKGATTVVFTTDIDCDHCVTKIMNNVPSLGKGVKDIQADVKTKELTVVFDASKNDVEHIIKGLESIKVKATPMTIDGKEVKCCKAGTCAEAKACKSDACADAKCCEKGSCTDAKCCETGTCADKKCCGTDTCKAEACADGKCCDKGACAAKK